MGKIQFLQAGIFAFLLTQSEIYARQGIDLGRSTMADWIGGIARAVNPLAELIGRYVVSAAKLHADDAPVRVLDPRSWQDQDRAIMGACAR